MKSANKLYLRKVRLDRILVQYFAIFILAESKSIAIAELINISFSALSELSYNSTLSVLPLGINAIGRLIVRIPVRQISEPAI